MYIRHKEIELIEYDPKIIKGKKKVNKPKKKPVCPALYKVNLLRLAVAVAKCTFTKTPDRNYQFAESVINIIRVATLIHKSKDNRFLLNKNRLDLIRDFSKTTRIGELAQGISFLFVQDILKTPTPYDFIGYCDIVHKRIPKGSTPDFIGCHSAGTYDLIESKGTLDHKPTTINSRLNEALKQCLAGEKFLKPLILSNAKRKYGVLSSFELDNSSSPKNTSIHFIDPEEETQSVFNSWQLIVEYYSSIIKGFTGLDIEKAFQIKDFEEKSISGQSFKFFNLFLPDIGLNDLPKINYPRFIKFGISLKILELIANVERFDEEYFECIKQIIDSRNIENSKLDMQVYYEFFSDGTVIKIN